MFMIVKYLINLHVYVIELFNNQIFINISKYVRLFSAYKISFLIQEVP